MVTSTMTSLSSCWTLSFLSLVSVIKILCVLGLVPLGSTRNTGMPHLTSASKCLVLSHNIFVLSIFFVTLRICSKFVRPADKVFGSKVVRNLKTASF